MVAYYQDKDVTVYNKDCRDMSELKDESVHCVVTSPPYFGLRKYKGLPDSIWGDKGCQHEWGDTIPNPMCKSGKHGPASCLTKTADAQHAVRKESNQGNFCSLCGAWQGQLGNEPTIEIYIQHLIEIFREVKRVLRNDGCLFVNISDSYTASGGAGGDYNKGGQPKYEGRNLSSLKPSDLCLIPERFVLAMQAEGFYVRQRIIWHKPSCMPQSVKSRPTTDYEFIYLLTKSPSNKYFWDCEAVREKAEDWGTRDRTNFRNGTDDILLKHHGLENCNSALTGRNLRSVWAINSGAKPKYLSGHYATFPVELPTRCIKAATSEYGCCALCGKPWERTVKIKGKQITEAMKASGCDKSGGYKGQDIANYTDGLAQSPSDTKRRVLEGMSHIKEFSWHKSCNCKTEERTPCLVLDCFAGTGTTLWAAKKLGRKAVGYELSESYCKLIIKRNAQQVIL